MRANRLWWRLPTLLLAAIAVRAWSMDILPVTTAPLESILIYPEQSAPATVISANNSRLSAEVTAVIERMPVEVGEIVEPGTPLAELRKTDVELQIRKAKATLRSLAAKKRLAKEQFQRVRSLADRRSVTEQLVSQRKTELEVSDADLAGERIRIEQLQRTLEKTVIRAPFRGIVVERLASVGELAQPGTPLLRMVDGSSIELSARVQSGDVESLVRAGRSRFFSGDGEFEMDLERVIPVIDERERSQEVRLRFLRDPALIGSSGHLRWREVEAFIPADILVRRNGAMGVFVVNDEFAQFEIIPRADEGRPVRNSLPLDAILVIDGRFVVRDGQPLRTLSGTMP